MLNPDSKLVFENNFSQLNILLRERIKRYFGSKTDVSENIFNTNINEKYRFIQEITKKQTELNIDETILISIAITPHLYPHFFDQVIQQTIPKAGDFPQLGGVRGKNFRGFLPTGETALFILAGEDFEKRMEVQQYFDEDHFFAKKNILWLEPAPSGEPRMSGKIIMSQEYIDLFTTGKVAQPKFSTEFPAQLIETELEWSDIILNKKTTSQIKELEVWIKHGDRLMNDFGMRKKLIPGYRALFYGPPGTGKTLTARLLGKYTGRDVYRIDLSMMVSKFIGETEKNLSKLFSKAENKNWILFFDEADALFGKRTNVKDAHDKYANQEVSYLLQRVESYNGLVILATNFRTNIDEAFIRRFQSIINFPRPNATDRLAIWRQAFPQKMSLGKEVNLASIADRYELSGGEIMNIVHFSCLQTLAEEKEIISEKTLLLGVQREYEKEGKIMR